MTIIGMVRWLFAGALLVVAAVGVALRVADGGGVGEGRGVSASARAVSLVEPPRQLPPALKPSRRLVLPRDLRVGSVALPILMFHRIDVVTAGEPDITRRLTVAPATFAAEMRWLSSNGYHAVTERDAYDAVVRARRLPSRPVLLTFDDGYRDVLRYAAPVLRRLHMPATVYVITERVSSGDATWLSWADLRSMERSGMDVGSHTVAHRDLTSLSPAAAMRQLVRSRHVLERHLHHPVQWFAYPFGAVDPAVVAMTRQAGYVLAVTTKPGSVQDPQHPLQLHRFEVLDSTGVAGVASLVAAGTTER